MVMGIEQTKARKRVGIPKEAANEKRQVCVLVVAGFDDDF